MSSPEFQLAFGVKESEVIAALKEAGVVINKEEVYLVDEGVFKGMYNGNGNCPEWLGLELYMLDNYSPFIDISELNYEKYDQNLQCEHKSLYEEEVVKLHHWLEENGYGRVDDLELPSPSYFIACGTD